MSRCCGQTVWLRRDRTVLADGLRETFTLVNRSDQAISVELRLDLAADLAPIETIKHGDGAFWSVVSDPFSRYTEGVRRMPPLSARRPPASRCLARC